MHNHRMYRERTYAFSKQLLVLRTRTTRSQLVLANAVGVHRRSFQNWETGESYPKADTLRRLITVLLEYGAFTAGQELEEASTLWRLAVEDGQRPLGDFNEAWFTSLRDEQIPDGDPHARTPPTSTSPANLPVDRPPHHTMIDWGEAIAAPMLYGRDRELETLHRWIVEERCRVVAICGIGGMGKSSLAMSFVQQVMSQFDLVLFRSLQNGPPPEDVLDQIIQAVSAQHIPPQPITDKIALLVQLFRERRCLLILDNFETILQPDALTGTYRSGYDAYGALLQGLSAREHASCLVLTSREKPAELGMFEGRATSVHTLPLTGLDYHAYDTILKERDIVATHADLGALVQLYGGNPLALHLVTEPIHELFSGDVGAFLATGEPFFNGLGTLMEQQCARWTPLEASIMRWLAVERELVPLTTLFVRLGASVPQREVLAALESLLRRTQIERASDQLAFTLQPTIFEFLTDQIVAIACQEIVTRQPVLLRSHALMQATTKAYIRHSQERLIIAPLLERLVSICGSAAAAERQLLSVLDFWRDQPLTTQGYGPGNCINLLRSLRGNLRDLDLSRLLIRQVDFQRVEGQDTTLAEATIHESVFTETFNAIMTVAVSSTGAYWAALSRAGEVRVWTADGQTLHRAWQAHADTQWPLAFSPDGRTLAIGSGEGAVKLWDIASGALLWEGWHAGIIYRVAISPDGHTLVSGGNDATMRLWDTHTGVQLQTLVHPAPVIALAWSPDGDLLASGDEAGSIRLWQLRGAQPAVCIQTFPGHTKHLGFTFSPDGSMLASGSGDGTIRLWDIPSGHLHQSITSHTDWVSRVVWSPDGRLLAVCTREPEIWLWDREVGSYRPALQGHTADVWSVAFTPDSRNLLSGSDDGTIRLWDTASGRCVRVLQGYAVSLFDLDWSPDGSQLVSGGSDSPAMIWQVTGGTPRVLLGENESVFGVGWSSQGRWAAGAWDTCVFVWDPRSLAQIEVFRDAQTNFHGLAWNPDGTQLACGTYRRGVLVWDVAAGTHHWIGRQSAIQFMRVDWSPDGTQLASGGDDGAVYVWDAAHDTLLQRLPGHQGPIKSVAWSPDGTRLASGGGSKDGGEVFVWDVERGELLHAFTALPETIYAVAWGVNEHTIVSGGGNGTVRWWDVPSATCSYMHQEHQGTVQSLRRSPDGTRIASCGDDGAIVLWDLHSGEHLQTLRRDRPYERLTITGVKGLTEAQTATLRALGAVETMADQPSATSDSIHAITTEAHS